MLILRGLGSSGGRGHWRIVRMQDLPRLYRLPTVEFTKVLATQRTFRQSDNAAGLNRNVTSYLMGWNSKCISQPMCTYLGR